MHTTRSTRHLTNPLAKMDGNGLYFILIDFIRVGNFGPEPDRCSPLFGLDDQIKNVDDHANVSGRFDQMTKFKIFFINKKK